MTVHVIQMNGLLCQNLHQLQLWWPCETQRNGYKHKLTDQISNYSYVGELIK